MAKTVLGHIDCPTCGTKAGMRITHDKNGDPYGYCEASCSQQLRIGGDKHRVAAFLARFPWAKGAAPVTATGTEPARPAPAPATVAKAPAPAPRSMAGVFDQLLGGAR